MDKVLQVYDKYKELRLEMTEPLFNSLITAAGMILFLLALSY